MPIINFTSLRLWRRAIAVVLAVVVACGCAVAAEKSFLIEFACVKPTSGDEASVIAYYVNKDKETYLSSGSEYVETFNKITNTYREKNGIGWIVGSTSNNISSYAGTINMAFTELGQVKATRLEVNIKARKASSNTCYINVNGSLTADTRRSLEVGASYTFSFDLDGSPLQTLILQNVVPNDNTANNVPYNLTAIRVFYDDGEEEVVSDPEMQTATGAFATDGTEFGCGEGRLRFDHTVNIVGGAALFNTDNRLTVSAPAGYFLAAVEFQGASAEGSISASSGSVTSGKWLPAEGDIALNAVEFTAGSAESLKGVKISYLPFRIDHSKVLSTIDFTTTETTANSINIHSSFANSGKSTVERFIIRANGVQIAEPEPTDIEASFTGLPYLTDGRLTISPVIGGTERQPELLEGTTLPNLGATEYTISANMLLYTPRADEPALCDVGAVIRLSLPEDIPAGLYSNFQVSVANHPEAEIQPGNGFIDIYIPTYLKGIPFDGTRPDFTKVEFETFTITFTPTYQFQVAEVYRGLLTAPAAKPLKANVLSEDISVNLDGDGIQTVTFAEQQLQATFTADTEVSAIPALAADPADTTTHYYTLQGIEIQAADLNPGLYIQRRGQRSTLYRHR